MVKIELDEKKNRRLIRFKANEIRLKPYFERMISYREVDKRIKDTMLKNIFLFLVCSIIALIYLFAIGLINDECTNEELSGGFLIVISFTIGLEFASIVTYSMIKEFMISDYKREKDLEIIEKDTEK